MKAVLYVEGGGEDAALDSACREGFRKLLTKCGFDGRLPRIVACGGRQEAFRDFKIAHAQKKKAGYIGLLIDSEDPMADIDKPWDHLANRKDDQMPRPQGASDTQALIMTTCMETWIISDRAALKSIYSGSCLQESAFPSSVDLETRNRHEVQDALAHGTRNCSNKYKKGKRSFKVLAELNPETLRPLLPSFARVERILDENL